MTYDETDPTLETHRTPSDQTARRRVTVPVVVAAVGLVLGGATVAAAATAATDATAATHSTTSTDRRPDAGEQPGGDARRLHRLGSPLASPGVARMHGFRSIHGEFVVPDGDGGYQTVRTQAGEVTAVSSGSIAVRSDDGYRHTYAVSDDTRINAGREGLENVQTGHQVLVVAVADDDTDGGADQAVRVLDLTVLAASAHRWNDLEHRRGGPRLERPEEVATAPTSAAGWRA